MKMTWLSCFKQPSSACHAYQLQSNHTDSRYVLLYYIIPLPCSIYAVSDAMCHKCFLFVAHSAAFRRPTTNYCYYYNFLLLFLLLYYLLHILYNIFTYTSVNKKAWSQIFVPTVELTRWGAKTRGTKNHVYVWILAADTILRAIVIIIMIIIIFHTFYISFLFLPLQYSLISPGCECLTGNLQSIYLVAYERALFGRKWICAANYMAYLIFFLPFSCRTNNKGDKNSECQWQREQVSMNHISTWIYSLFIGPVARRKQMNVSW